MKDIAITIRGFQKSITMIVDEHPIVNDKDYVDVVSTKPFLIYEWDGSDCKVTGANNDDTYDDLLIMVESQVLFDQFFEDNWDKKFTDFNITPPLYDWEEDDTFTVNNIDNYINNCRFHEQYNDYRKLLIKEARKMYNVIMEEDLICSKT